MRRDMLNSSDVFILGTLLLNLLLRFRLTCGYRQVFHIDLAILARAYGADDGVEVTVWVGKGASRDERKQGLNMAVKYLHQAGLPKDTTICSVLEGGENEVRDAFLGIVLFLVCDTMI